MTKQTKKEAKKIPFDGILADVIFVLITITLNRYSNLIAEHIEIIFWTIGILQSLTIYAIMLNFDFNDPEFEKLPKFINSIMGLIFILAVGGFFWIFLPAIYLSFTEILIYISAHTENVDPGMAILAISISYLPIRFLMMIKPPNSIIELITATSVFSYFIYSLF